VFLSATAQAIFSFYYRHSYHFLFMMRKSYIKLWA
jgi:hypothetical protein